MSSQLCGFLPASPLSGSEGPEIPQRHFCLNTAWLASRDASTKLYTLFLLPFSSHQSHYNHLQKRQRATAHASVSADYLIGFCSVLSAELIPETSKQNQTCLILSLTSPGRTKTALKAVNHNRQVSPMCSWRFSCQLHTKPLFNWFHCHRPVFNVAIKSWVLLESVHITIVWVIRCKVVRKFICSCVMSVFLWSRHFDKIKHV